MKHLKAFYVFHVASASSGFSAAAAHLNITPGAVSKQVKVLESYLGQPLFIREGRDVLLTEVGEALKLYTQQAFHILETGVNALTSHAQQTIEVSCEPTLTMRWLMPRLAAFNEQYDADVRLSTAGGPVKLGATGLSMAIRRDDYAPLYPYPVTTLVAEKVGPVFSPSYWQQMKNELGAVKLLHSQTRPQAWADWMQCADHVAMRDNPEQSFAHFYFCIQAAIDGLGAAMGSYPLVMDDLKRGQLVAPFGFVQSGHDYVLVRQDKAPTELEQAFMNWLQVQMAECGGD